MRTMEAMQMVGVSSYSRGYEEGAKDFDRIYRALKACVAAHETGRYEPAQAAYENAKNVLADIENPESPFPTPPEG